MEPPCSICLNLDPFTEENKRWNVGSRDNCFEYVMEFVVNQLKISAKEGCLTCSTIWSGLELLSSSRRISPTFDSSSQRGRFIVQEDCPLEIELIETPDDDCEENPPVRIQYYTATGDPNRPAFGGAKEVPPDLSLSRCSTIILGWINDCQKHHRACVARVERSKLFDLPRRLIDAGKWETASDPVALIDSKDFDVWQYATLSHCWGKDQFIKTTKETIAERKKCIQWSALPKTFQDAISIVRSLNIRFIWIDSLCIIQDDGNDWTSESVRMAAIYSNGYINLAATGASDSRGGCFSPRSIKHISGNLGVNPVRVDLDAASTTPTIFARPSFDPIHRRYSTGKIQRSDLPDKVSVPLLSRAWVFQERHLAPRTVHFHPSEMIMECKSSLYCECTGLSKLVTRSRRNSFDKTDNDDSKTFDSWLTVVEEYSRLRLSWESDRLPALVGVASVFQAQLKSDYLAGIWSGDLARGLLWDVTRRIETSLQDSPRRHPRPQIPRWSWASLTLESEGIGIYFPACQNQTFEVDEHFSYVSTNMPVAATDIKPVGLDAAIWVRGRVISAGAFPSTQDPTIAEDITLVFDQDVDEEVLITTTEMSLDATYDVAECASTVLCLLVGKIVEDDWDAEQKVRYSRTLLLEAEEEYKSGEMPEQSYKRIGVLNIREGEMLFELATETILKLT